MTTSSLSSSEERITEKRGHGLSEAAVAQSPVVALPDHINPPSYLGSKSRAQIITLAILALTILVGSALLSNLHDSNGVSGWSKLKALIVNPDHTLAATSGALFCAMAAVVGVALWILFDNKEARFATWVQSLFANKNTCQTAILAGLAVALIASLPFILLAAQGCEPFKDGWKNFQALIVDPHTHTLATTSGAMFCALTATIGVAVWALIENKEERLGGRVKALFANKSEMQAGILTRTALLLTLALPFILLAVQGCQPFQEGAEQFRDFLFGASKNWYSTAGAILTLFCLGILAPIAISNSLVSVAQDEEKPWLESYLGKKSNFQKYSFIGISLFIATWGLILSMLALKGVAPFDQGWSNFKHLLLDHNTQAVDALPALGIITGLTGAVGVYAWGIFGTKESGKKIQEKFQNWWSSKVVWQKAVITIYALLFIAAIPLLILQAKGVGVHQALLGEFDPLVDSAVVFAVTAAVIGLGILYKPEKHESSFGDLD